MKSSKFGEWARYLRPGRQGGAERTAVGPDPSIGAPIEKEQKKN
jgi:hypothetical protein